MNVLTIPAEIQLLIIRHSYWEWGHDVDDPLKSPFLDGSPHSFGSDGFPLPSRSETWEHYPPPPLKPNKENILVFPAGLGGGCVMKGPFSNLTINLGPVAVGTFRETRPLLRHNPRCLKRDINPYIAQTFSSYNWTTWTIDESDDIAGFQGRLAGDKGGPNKEELHEFGVHGAGHTFVGGMTGEGENFLPTTQWLRLRHI